MLEVVDRHQGPPNRDAGAKRSTWLWKSYVRYRWSANDPIPSTALPMLLRSFARWPFPMNEIPSMKRLGRLKRLAYLMKQSIFATQVKPGGL